MLTALLLLELAAFEIWWATGALSGVWQWAASFDLRLIGCPTIVIHT